MKRGEIVRALELAYTTESLVWVRRGCDARPWRGFVVSTCFASMSRTLG